VTTSARRRFFIRLIGLACLAGLLASCSLFRREAPPAPRKGVRPYKVFGKTYQPLASARGFTQTGLASWYGEPYHGRKTANGETYNMYAMTAAHKTLPLGVVVEVVHLENGRRATVRINDRGPFVRGRIIDLSYEAAKRIGMVRSGVARVRIAVVDAGRTTRKAPARSSGPSSPAVRLPGPFSVQVGSFTRWENAHRMREKVYRRFRGVRIDVHSDGVEKFYRVRVGRYTSMGLARSALATLEAAGYRDAFVVALE